jgi:hypothetical protein
VETFNDGESNITESCPNTTESKSTTTDSWPITKENSSTTTGRGSNEVVKFDFQLYLENAWLQGLIEIIQSTKEDDLPEERINLELYQLASPKITDMNTEYDSQLYLERKFGY